MDKSNCIFVVQSVMILQPAKVKLVSNTFKSEDHRHITVIIILSKSTYNSSSFVLKPPFLFDKAVVIKLVVCCFVCDRKNFQKFLAFFSSSKYLPL